MGEGKDSRQFAIRGAPHHDVGGLARFGDEERDGVEERSHIDAPTAHRHWKLPQIEDGGVLGLTQPAPIDEDDCATGVVWMGERVPLKS